jgi:hypothetical protein
MFWPKLHNALQNGQIEPIPERFHAAGYKKKTGWLNCGNGIITVTNLHNVTEVPIDFPTAVEL